MLCFDLAKFQRKKAGQTNTIVKKVNAWNL